MSTNSASFRNVRGLEELSAALLGIPDDMRMRTLAAGVKGAVLPIEIAAKRFAKRSEDTGALRDSITHKVKNYPQSGKCVGLVGPDRAYYARGRKVKGIAVLTGGATLRKPANYAHLVEFGHIAVAPKRGVSRRKKTATDIGFVPAKPFIRPAVTTTLDLQAAGFFQGVASGFNAAVNREVSSGRHVA